MSSRNGGRKSRKWNVAPLGNGGARRDRYPRRGTLAAYDELVCSRCGWQGKRQKYSSHRCKERDR